MKMRAVKITDETLADWRSYQEALGRGGADDPKVAVQTTIHGRLQSLLHVWSDPSAGISRSAYSPAKLTLVATLLIVGSLDHLGVWREGAA